MAVERGDDQDSPVEIEAGVDVAVRSEGKFKIQVHDGFREQNGGAVLPFPVNRAARIEMVHETLDNVFFGGTVRSGAVAQGWAAEFHMPKLEPGEGFFANGSWCDRRQTHGSKSVLKPLPESQVSLKSRSKGRSIDL